MSLSRVVLAILIILIAMGIAAGMWIVVAGQGGEQDAGDGQSRWPDGEDMNPELPPPENAWKPATWYSEMADGTLFPNQPSPSFRIPADSSLHHAITQRDLEDRAAGQPTMPHASVHSGSLASTEPHPPTEPDELEALSQVPTVKMEIVPVKDDLPTTLKSRAVRPARRDRSTHPLADQEALPDGSGTDESAELGQDWSEDGSGPAREAGTPVAADPAPAVSTEPEPPAPVDKQYHDDYGSRDTEAYTEAIHLGYYADLDAITISFTGCSIRNSSDVPMVFKTITQKLDQLLAEQEWRQHALLLDVAGLDVAAEAESAWQLVLEGFVSQFCPEVTPNSVLAVQYDSSRPPGMLPSDENTDTALHSIPQPVGDASGRPALMPLARSFDEAIGMLQRMCAGM